MRPVYYSILLSVLLVAGCGRGGGEKFVPRPFPQVSVPAIYADDRESALEYAALHFWDAMTDTARAYPSDTVLVSGVRRDDVEEAYANYIGLLGMLPYTAASDALCVMTDKASACERADTASNVFETVVHFTEKYLYDPNSPMRNEDLYLSFARKMADCSIVPSEKRRAYEREAGLCSLNMTGSRAADFQFSDRYGKVRTLFGVRAEYTLLFFSNPGCEACAEIISVLASDRKVNEMIGSGRLAVVNVYIDEDIASWYEYMPLYPENWYSGYDHNLVIRTDMLYNVRAIPSLYLLDRDKTVLMKDAVPENVFSFLENLGE